MARRRSNSVGSGDDSGAFTAGGGGVLFGMDEQSVREEATTHAVLIESFHKPGVTLTFCAFFVMVAICLLLGLAGPAVLVTRGNANALACASENCTAVWKGTLVHMNVLHQVLYLEATIERTELSPGSEDVGLEYQQEVVVSAMGLDNDNTPHVILNHKKHIRTVTCPAGRSKCDPIVVFAQNFIHYTKYELEVQFIHPDQAFQSQGVVGTLLIEFDLHRVNSNFTIFEMAVKYCFLAVTVVLAAVYFFKLTKVPFRLWSYEQKWIGAVLVGLMFFDNPLVAMEVYNPSLIWTGTSVVGMVTFLALLLLFWLCIVDVVRTSAQDEPPPRGIRFYLPKVALLTAFWMVIMILYMFSRLQQERDPSFNAPDDFHTFVFVKGLAFGLVGLYTLWILGLICMAMKQMSDLSLPFKVVFLLSFFTIVGLLVCLFLGAYSPLTTDSLLFMALFGITNVYVFTLAVAYMPWLHERASNIRHGELELGSLQDSGDDAGLMSAHQRQDHAHVGQFAITDDDDDQFDDSDDDVFAVTVTNARGHPIDSDGIDLGLQPDTGATGDAPMASTRRQQHSHRA